MENIKDIIHRLTSCSESLQDIDLWDNETMDKINKAEKLVKEAITELVEVVGDGIDDEDLLETINE